MSKDINIKYLAQIGPEEENKSKPFEAVWAECAGKYPFKVTAIDSTVNRNGWGIVTPERLQAFANLMPGKQIRVDHSDKALDTMGRFETANFLPKSNQVISKAWTIVKDLAIRIHHGILTDMSMQARANNVICGSCAEPMDDCNCDNSWKSLLDPVPVEGSIVAEGAYLNTKINEYPSGFKAAVEKVFEKMDEDDTMAKSMKELESEMATMKAALDKFQAELPSNSQPQTTDSTPAGQAPHVTQPTNPVVPNDGNVEAMEEDKEEKYKKMEAKCKAQEEELNKYKKESKAMDEKDDDKEKAMDEDKEDDKETAGLETSMEFSSRRNAPNSAGRNFSAGVPTTPPNDVTWENYQSSYLGDNDGKVMAHLSHKTTHSSEVEAIKNAHPHLNATKTAICADLLKATKDQGIFDGGA